MAMNRGSNRSVLRAKSAGGGRRLRYAKTCSAGDTSRFWIRLSEFGLSPVSWLMPSQPRESGSSRFSHPTSGRRTKGRERQACHPLCNRRPNRQQRPGSRCAPGFRPRPKESFDPNYMRALLDVWAWLLRMCSVPADTAGCGSQRKLRGRDGLVWSPQHCFINL